MDRTDLTQRAALPDALRVLLDAYPRPLWTSHRNFDGLTRFWLERHLMFRRALAEWQQETQGWLDKGRDAQAHQRRSAQIGGFLINELHGHHQIEDAHYFPTLSAVEPRLVAGFELLDRDHHALDAELAALTDATNTHLQALSDKAAAPMKTAGALLERLEGFGRFLDRHLVDEEDLVVPVILHHAPRF
ncbi:MAG: hemerythrin domain-containing protein [Roseinatronobacter sp.]